MRISWTGKISDNFYSLGIPSVPVYLFDGAIPVLLDASLAALSLLYERQIREVLGTCPPCFRDRLDVRSNRPGFIPPYGGEVSP